MGASKVDDDKLIRDRAVRLFTYLRELAKLKTAVTRDLAAYDKVVWFHDVPEHKGCFSILQSPDFEKTQDGIWLEVRKTPDPKRPPMPPLCLKWLAYSPDSDPLDEPQLKDEIVDNISGRRERLADHPEISEEWQQYVKNTWIPWTDTYRQWKTADAIYFQLFSIHQQLKKLGEQYELILGLGLLTWETPNNQVIKRHIVVGDAYLNFDADRAKFTLQGAAEGVKLHFETEMVEPGQLPPLDQQKNTEALLSEVQESPWDKDEIDKILRSWIQSLSPDGTYSDSLIPPEKYPKTPIVTFAPALILRKRTQRSQIQCFNTIIEQIKGGGDVTSGVQLLCKEADNSFDTELREKADEMPVLRSTLPPEQYNLPLETMKFSVRTFNCLKRGGINTLVQLLEKSEEELISLPHFHEKCRQEVEEKLRLMGYVLPVKGVKETAASQSNAYGQQIWDNTLYLPLATNEEQIQIAHHIRNSKGILVQGPPGTGKSHTIANLICHLLAQGKRVLVTSQTPRALRVLKEKIPREVSALCVTLLGDDHASRQELEASVGTINQQYSTWNSLKSQNEIKSLESLLFEIKKDIADKKRLLREQREIETYHHDVASGAYKGTAQQIASRVHEEEAKFNWLDDDVKENTPCPLTNTEFVELLRLYRELPDAYCSELRQELISQDSIPNISYFMKMVEGEKTAKQNFENHSSRQLSPRFLFLRQIKEENLKAMFKAISDLLTKIGGIKETFTWTSKALSDILNGNDTHWKGLHTFLTQHSDGLTEKVHIVQSLEVQIPDLDRKKLREDAEALLYHLENGGRLGWKFFAPKIVKRTNYVRKQVCINGQMCMKLEKLKLLVTYLEVAGEIELLWSALEGVDQRQEGSIILQMGYLQGRLNSLIEILGITDYVSKVRGCVEAIAGLAELRWHKIEELQEMLQDIEAVEAWQTLKQASSAIGDSIRRLQIVLSSPKAHNLNKEFLSALENRDSKTWAECLEKLESLEKNRKALLRREQLNVILSKAAPKLCQAMQNTFTDNIWDERTTQLTEAWAWKQTGEWLIKFGQEHNEAKLEIELQKLSEQEGKTISNLAAGKAWSNCLSQLTPFHRNNLVAWAIAMNRMPKTLSAKTRPKWMKEAQECMDNCKSAIPAWIMPLYRVFDTIIPAPECFDVIIIDEASQTGPEGLILNYLAKQVIIVGDSEQISPNAVGIPEDNIDSLVKRYLGEIPFKNFYHPETSVFSFAAILFSSKIVLREHFRCMPEIIQFSNQLCYSATPLKPLRQYPPKRLEPIIVKQVKNGYREGPVGNILNRPEADELVEAIVKMCLLEEYADKTMGVISLQGEAQAKYIENKLLARLSPLDLEKRRIVCGDAYAFQGDERDVIFLSMVAAPNERIGPLTKESDKRRFNVAASRARDQLILFHTATLSDLHPDCMRYKLLEYCLNPIIPQSIPDIDLVKLRELSKTADARRWKPPPPFDSWFEVDVFFNIIDRGFRVIPQYGVAEHRIDLVVEGTKSRLAVECDGDEWHGIEEYERDQVRQRILERCGWRFWRIRGYEYYHDPVGSLESLWKTLREMGIEPLVATASNKNNSSPVKHESNLIQVTQSAYRPTVEPDTSSLKEQPLKEKSVTPLEHNVQLPMNEAESPISSQQPQTNKSEISDYTPDFLMELASKARKMNLLEPWERSILYKTGKWRNQNWEISMKMDQQALRIIKKAKQLGLF